MVFNVFNYTFITIAALTCVIPFINLLAISFSSSGAAATGKVLFWPIEFDLSAYKYILRSDKFFRSFFISLQRVGLGVAINLVVVILTAYPLSKSSGEFKSRGIYAWFFMFTMLFSPSLIPSFLVVKQLGLIDTIWALVLPCALPVFNMVVMLNFFRGLPKELEEAAVIDGAGHLTILLRIFIPLSKPSIATIALFCIVNHWNAWFDGMIYMNRPENYPLQSYLQSIVVSPESIMRLMNPSEEMIKILQSLSNKTARAAQLFVATIPVLVAYPFLQKYFTTGLVVGSVKE
ncbi:MAG: carbohydrate ABC transporter permease [Oscillospiraceae bacterium]